MPDIATALKAEISRLARKQARQETQGLKKVIAPYRSEIADLKRRAQALEQLVRKLGRSVPKTAPVEPDSETSLRFSAKGLAKNRQRLGLSAAGFGKLIGASGQSVYKWEEGKARPRANYLAAIASIRAIGKKEALARLQLTAE